MNNSSPLFGTDSSSPFLYDAAAAYPTNQQLMSVPTPQQLHVNVPQQQEQQHYAPMPTPIPPSSKSGGGGSGSGSEGVYYSTLFAVTALPTGIIEALMHYVAIKSGPRASVVALGALLSSLGALYASRAAVKSKAEIPTRKLLVTSITSAVAALISSALVSRLDSRVRGAPVSAISVGLVTGLAACGGELLSKK